MWKKKRPGGTRKETPYAPGRSRRREATQTHSGYESTSARLPALNSRPRPSGDCSIGQHPDDLNSTPRTWRRAPRNRRAWPERPDPQVASIRGHRNQIPPSGTSARRRVEAGPAGQKKPRPGGMARAVGDDEKPLKGAPNSRGARQNALRLRSCSTLSRCWQTSFRHGRAPLAGQHSAAPGRQQRSARHRSGLHYLPGHR